MVTRWGRRANGALIMALAIGAASILVKAAGLTSRYDAEIQRLRSEWQAAQKIEGLDARRGARALYDKYPTPEIALCKAAVVAPGATGAVRCSGRFTPKTTFLVDHDQVALTSGAASATTYGATARVAADALPGFVRLFAYAPVSGAWSSRGAIVIGAVPTFTLTASNGWTIVVTPEGKTWVADHDSASLTYRAEYFTQGSTAAFEKMRGALTVSAAERPGQAYTFSLQPGGTGTAMQEYQELMVQMGDPATFMKMSARERAAFEKKMEDVGDRMTREMEAMTAEPAAMIDKQAQFGCGSITVAVEGSQVTGSVSCGQKVGHLTLSGRLN